MAVAVATPAHDRLQRLSVRNPLLVGPIVWGVACVGYAAYRGPEVPLASPELLEEQLQRRLGNIPVPPDSAHYQQYRQYYIRQHEQNIEEYNKYVADPKQDRSGLHWETLSQGLSYGIMLFGAMLAYCEYHFGTISFWMDSAEESYCVALENWQTSREKSRKLAEDNKMESLLREMGEGSESAKASTRERKKVDAKKTAQTETVQMPSSSSSVRQRKDVAKAVSSESSAAPPPRAERAPPPRAEEASDAFEGVKMTPQVRAAPAPRIPEGSASSARERLRRKMEEKRRQMESAAAVAGPSAAAKPGSSAEASSDPSGWALLHEAEALLCELEAAERSELEAAELLRQVEAEGERKQLAAKKKAQRRAAERAAKSKPDADSKPRVDGAKGDKSEPHEPCKPSADVPGGEDEDEDSKFRENDEPEPEEEQQMEAEDSEAEGSDQQDAQAGAAELDLPGAREDSCDDSATTTTAPNESSGDEHESSLASPASVQRIPASNSDEDGSRSGHGDAIADAGREHVREAGKRSELEEPKQQARAAWADILDDESEDGWAMEDPGFAQPQGDDLQTGARTRHRRARGGRLRSGRRNANEAALVSALPAAEAQRCEQAPTAPAAPSSPPAWSATSRVEPSSVPSASKASWASAPRPAQRAAPRSWAQAVASPSFEDGDMEASGIVLQELKGSSVEQIREWLQANGTPASSTSERRSKEELLRLASELLQVTFQRDASASSHNAQVDKAEKRLRAEAPEFVPGGVRNQMFPQPYAPEVGMQQHAVMVVQVPIQVPEGAQFLPPGQFLTPVPDGMLNLPEGVHAQAIPVMQGGAGHLVQMLPEGWAPVDAPPVWG